MLRTLTAILELVLGLVGLGGKVAALSGGKPDFAGLDPHDARQYWSLKFDLTSATAQEKPFPAILRQYGLRDAAHAEKVFDNILQYHRNEGDYEAFLAVGGEVTRTRSQALMGRDPMEVAQEYMAQYQS